MSETRGSLQNKRPGSCAGDPGAVSFSLDQAGFGEFEPASRATLSARRSPDNLRVQQKQHGCQAEHQPNKLPSWQRSGAGCLFSSSIAVALKRNAFSIMAALLMGREASAKLNMCRTAFVFEIRSVAAL
jgi:hypothetical protein